MLNNFLVEKDEEKSWDVDENNLIMRIMEMKIGPLLMHIINRHGAKGFCPSLSTRLVLT